jgi:hypothetical protein
MADKVLLDLKPRYQAAYGFAPLLHGGGIGQIPGGEYANLYSGQTLYTTGNRFFEELQLVHKGQDVNLRFGAFRLSKSGDMGDYFAPPPMLGFSKSKTAIITQIDGGEGEIVELYNAGTWVVKIQGLIVDMANHEFPLQKISQLDNLFRVQDGFEVSSQIMDALSIYGLWFPEVEITPLQGFQDTVQFTLTGRATKPVEFFLNGEEEQS